MEMPVLMFDSRLHKLDVSYMFCSGCRKLFPEDVLMTHNTTGQALCDSCSCDTKKSREFERKGTVTLTIAALALLMLAIPARAQTSTDHTTTCATDANDVTTCTTQPNYAEELRRAQADEQARREADQRFWQQIDQERREGDKLHQPVEPQQQTKQKN